MAIDPDKFSSVLRNRKSELIRLIDAAAGAAVPVELDQQVQGRLSRMDAIQGQAMAQATRERRRLEIAQIEAALRRIEADEYGYCVSCGAEIGIKRLELNPAISRCIDCAD